jgi:hypothetical protein
MMSDTLKDGWMPFVRRSKYMSSASAAGPDAVQLPRNSLTSKLVYTGTLVTAGRSKSMTFMMNITSMDEHSDKSQKHEANGSTSSGRNNRDR